MANAKPTFRGTGPEYMAWTLCANARAYDVDGAHENSCKIFWTYMYVSQCYIIVYFASSAAIASTHTRPFNGPLSGTIRVSRYRKGKTNLDFTEARDSEWQWAMQVCTSLQNVYAQLIHKFVYIKYTKCVLQFKDEHFGVSLLLRTQICLLFMHKII